MFSIRALADRQVDKRSGTTFATSAATSTQRDHRRFAAAFKAFRTAYPGYDSTAALDRLRASAYGVAPGYGQF